MLTAMESVAERSRSECFFTLRGKYRRNSINHLRNLVTTRRRGLHLSYGKFPFYLLLNVTESVDGRLFQGSM